MYLADCLNIVLATRLTLSFSNSFTLLGQRWFSLPKLITSFSFGEWGKSRQNFYIFFLIPHPEQHLCCHCSMKVTNSIYFFIYIAEKPFLTCFNIQILAELDFGNSYFIFTYITNKDFGDKSLLIYPQPHVDHNTGVITEILGPPNIRMPNINLNFGSFSLLKFAFLKRVFCYLLIFQFKLSKSQPSII